jgi:hypothetical protein
MPWLQSARNASRSGYPMHASRPGGGGLATSRSSVTGTGCLAMNDELSGIPVHQAARQPARCQVQLAEAPR